jgi:hypothetical protein
LRQCIEIIFSQSSWSSYSFHALLTTTNQQFNPSKEADCQVIIEFGGHGNNLLVVWGFGTPLSLLPEPIILAHGGGHHGLMREIDELAIKVVFLLVPDVRLEVVAGEDVIGIKEAPNRIINIGTAGKQLHVILVKPAIDLADIAADRGCKHS